MSNIARVEVGRFDYDFVGEFKFFKPDPDGKVRRPSVLVRLTDEDGLQGWGQAVPVPSWTYETVESVETTLANYLAEELLGADPSDFADIHNPGYGTHMQLEGTGDESVIKNWVDSRAWVEWMLNAGEAGNYTVEALIKAGDGNTLTVTAGDQEVIAQIPSTGEDFKNINLGEIEISEQGDLVLSLRPVRNEWNGIELAGLELVKN